MISAASSAVMSGYRARITPIATDAADQLRRSRRTGTEAGAIPANVSENIRPTSIAGLAKLVELVKK